MEILQLIVSGIAQGCIYGLLALSFVLIYKATETVSFVQGDIMMMGAFLAFIVMTVFGVPFWLTIIIVIAVIALVGMLIEKVAIRPILGEPMFSIVMLTLGLGYIIRGIVIMIPEIGTNTQALAVPYKDSILKLGGVVLAGEHVAVIFVTAVLCFGLFFLFKYSKVGIAMQATSQNQLAAYYMGIPVKRLNGFVWGLAAVLAAISGILLAPITFVYVNMGFIGLKAFPAAVIGGFGGLPGAIVGGMIIGLLEVFSGFYLPEGFRDITPYIAVLIMLMIRPNGLFGEKLRKKV